MAPFRRRRLTDFQRIEIARARAAGASPQELAARFGVSRQTVHATVRSYRDAPAVLDARTQVVGVRVSRRRLEAFEAALAAYGLTKTEGLRRLMDAATMLLAPDRDVARSLQSLAAEVHRVGGNLNPATRALNEARMMGQPVRYTEAEHAALRAAIGVVFEVAGQVGQMARGRRGELDVAVREALRGEDGRTPDQKPDQA